MSRATFIFVVVVLAGCRSSGDFSLSEKDGNVGFALAPELRQKILSPATGVRIKEVTAVHYVSAIYRDQQSHEMKGYGLVQIKLSLIGDFGFEGISHRELYFARRPGDADWREAVEFFLPRGVEFDSLHEMHPDDLRAIVTRKKSA